MRQIAAETPLRADQQRQRHYDRLHHQDRLQWLSGPSPMWADGTPVGKHEQAQMVNASREQLHLIDEHRMAVNDVDLDDRRYLAYLDDRASAAPRSQ